MRRAVAYVMAAVLGGGMGYLTAAPSQAADRSPNESRAARGSDHTPPQLPDGFQMKELNELDSIRKELATVTNIALKKDNFGQLVDSLALVNRERMKDYKNQDFKTLDGVIDQIRRDWQAKYGHEFDLTKASDVFTDRYVIVQGVVTNPQVAATKWPVPAAENAELAQGRVPAEAGGAENVERDDLQKSKGVALARFPGGHQMPALTASLVDERGHGWRFAAPLGMTSQQLHNQLQNHLTAFDQEKSSWPADENQAYRAAAHHVLAAIYDVNVSQAERARG